MAADETYVNKPWLALYPEDYPARLQPRFDDLLSAFRDAVERSPGDTAIRYFDTGITYADLDRSSDAIALVLRDRGTSAGDRVSILMQNMPAFVEVSIAAWKLGAVPVPHNPAYRPAELSKLFADCTPRAIVCEAALEAVIAEALMLASHEAGVLVVNPADHQGSDDWRVLPRSATEPQAAAWLYAEAARHTGRPPPLLAAGSDLALLLYTSGTTGVPKGVMIRHDSLAFNAQAMGQWGHVQAASRVLGIAPLFHITGFVSHMSMCIVARCTLILHYRFEAGAVLDVIRQSRPTYVVGAITAFNAMMNAPGVSESDFASFDDVYSGGAAIAPALCSEIRRRLGIDIRPCYGMTETVSPTHASPPGHVVPVDPDSGALAIGIPIFSTEAMIVDDSDRPAPVGDRGELWMRGPQIMAGYWNRPAETLEALCDGWMRSGDIACMDSAGWFYLVDRKKDMINASGFKVWPREIEDCLHQHVAVREAAVVGVPDAYRGENVVAYISLKTSATVSEDDIMLFCREHLTGYKIPRRVWIVDDLPKTATGKIQRNLVREMACSESKA